MDIFYAVYVNYYCREAHLLVLSNHVIYTTQKMKFSIKDLFSKCDQIRSFLRIWSHLLQKSLMENLIFCAVIYAQRRIQNFAKHLRIY